LKEKSSVWLPVAWIIVFAITRWPGVLPLNFSAAYALAFCAGVYFPGSMAWWLPLTSLVSTDVVMNLFYYHVAPVNAYMLVNYAAYCVIIAVGRRFSSRTSSLGLLGGSLLGATWFYLITNTASWLQNPEYTKTLAGWIQALTTGIPRYPPTWMFFRDTLLSTGLFTALFTGAMKLTEKAEAKEPEPAEDGDGEEQPDGAQTEESKA